MRHTQYRNDLLSCLTAGALAEMLRRLCATKGAFAPPRLEYDTSSRAREQVHDLQGKGWRLTGTVAGWWVRADLSVQRTRTNAESATTWCGTEQVYAAVQQAKH